MGYTIEVEHSKLETTADAVGDYITNMNTKMRQANQAVTSMYTSWKGTDATGFRMKWNTVDDEDSTYNQMKKSLVNYESFLRMAATKYKTAQANAVNRASFLNIF